LRLTRAICLVLILRRQKPFSVVARVLFQSVVEAAKIRKELSVTATHV
jgi:hypothetical protein